MPLHCYSIQQCQIVLKLVQWTKDLSSTPQAKAPIAWGLAMPLSVVTSTGPSWNMTSMSWSYGCERIGPAGPWVVIRLKNSKAHEMYFAGRKLVIAPPPLSALYACLCRRLQPARAPPPPPPCSPVLLYAASVDWPPRRTPRSTLAATARVVGARFAARPWYRRASSRGRRSVTGRACRWCAIGDVIKVHGNISWSVARWNLQFYYCCGKFIICSFFPIRSCQLNLFCSLLVLHLTSRWWHLYTPLWTMRWMASANHGWWIMWWWQIYTAWSVSEERKHNL